MKFLGIDYGEKRIGIATSDDGGILAFPKEIIKNEENTIEILKEIIEREKIDEIIVGQSLDYKNQPNKIEEMANIFIKDLRNKINLPIHRQKEFFTSVEARKSVATINGSSKVDDTAAALILQRYLDKINNNKI